MQPLKAIQGLGIIPFLKDISGRINWLYCIVGLVAVVLLIALVVFFLMRRRGRRKTGDPLALDAAGQEAKHKTLSGRSLTRIWKEFLRDLPPKFRRSIMLYDPFVVFGESGVGKSLLIDNYTDWQGNAHQFYPSYTASPLLQIYLGSKVVVQEICASLLGDTSRQARAAFLKLWKPLFKGKEPVVVIALNGTAFQSDTPESLKRQAQMLRGKINLIAQIRRKPIKAGIALTHMDQIEGFAEFSNFLRSNNISLKLEFPSKKDAENLAVCLEPYENYLSLALTTLPAADYMKIISFLRQAPELFSTLSLFVKILQAPDRLSPAPEIIRFTLASHREEGGDSNISNPFAAPVVIKKIKYDPLLKHKQAAAAILSMGLLYLGCGYFYERSLLTKIDDRMDTVEAVPATQTAQYDEAMHNLLLNCTERLKTHPLLALFPNYFPQINESNRQRVIKDIRESYLLPELKQVREGVEAEKAVYILGLIYASQHNDLGRFILDHISEWKQRFSFPESLIKDYIKYNDSSLYALTPPYTKSLPILPPSFNRQQWMLFLREATNSTKEPFITQAKLQELQKQGGLIMEDIKEYEHYDFNVKIGRLLEEEAPSIFHIAGTAQDKDLSDIQQKSIREFLDFVQQLNMDYPDVAGGSTAGDGSTAGSLSLSQFLENLKTMEALKAGQTGAPLASGAPLATGAPRAPDKKFLFSFADKEFSFSSKEWNAMIDRSRMSLFMWDFINRNNKQIDGLLFFPQGKTYPDLVMNPGNNGLWFFNGKGSVPGVYTRAAFNESIKPILLELPDLLEKLDVAEDIKMLFSDFISKEVKSYAEDYVSEYQNYYHQFEIKSSSAGGLNYVLTQMQLPSSPFQEFLISIKENTDLNLEANPYFQTFAAKLHTFDFIQRLMLERKGLYPELEKYKAILGQMQEDLKGDKPFVPKNAMDDSNELKRQLSPLGRMSLAIFRNEDDSYLNLIEMWLKNVDISPEWQEIFRAPVRDAYLQGLTEVQAMVDKVSKQLWVSDVQTVINKFPFNTEAANEVTLAEMESLVHPHGEFWKTFQKYLAPVCLKTGDTWTARQAASGSLHMPQNMLEMVNELTRIGKTFWDENGAPKPIKFTIKPFVLPQSELGGPIMVLSYLKSGKSAVFGFNQQPAWHEFEFEWWKEPNAMVGVEYITSINSRKNYRAITAPESCWSFYQLLRMGETLNENVAGWRMKEAFANGSADLLTIKFAMKTDPWALFRLVQSKNQGSSALAH
jgi:hypothetical protein